MAIVSNLNLLRGKHHKTKIFGSFHNPTTLWTAQVTGGPSRADTTISFNNGSGTSFALIEALQEVLVGTAVNSNDIGRFRIRSINSGDGGVTGTLVVAHNGLVLTNGDWLTFKLNYPLKPLWPKIDPPPLAADFFKDFDITYTNENELLRPVVIAGGNRAGFIDTTLGYWEINPQLNNSYSMHPGSGIVSYAAVALPATGVTISINPATGVGTIRFATAGNYWIKYTVTDANGTSQISYRFYRVHVNDPTSEHYPIYDFSVNNVVGNWDKGGWNCGVAFHDNGTLEDFPDRCIAIIWQHDTFYDETAGGITFDNETDSSTLISGYLRKESLSTPLPTDLQSGTYSIETIESLMKNQFMYSISLEAKNVAPIEWYEFRNELTCTRGVHHLWRWHSTLMHIADVIGLNTNTDLRAFVELENGNLYSMANNLLQNTGIRYHIYTDHWGRVHTIPDLQLLPDADRAGLTEIFVLDNLDLSENITLIRQVPFVTVATKTSGFTWDGSFTVVASDDCPNPPCPDPDPYCAVQRNTIATDEGASIVTLDRQTFRSPDGQAHANEIAGRLYAKQNNPIKEIRLDFHGNYSGVLEMFVVGYYDFTISSDDTVRGIEFTNKQLYAKNVQLIIDVTKGTIVCRAVFEPEAEGYDGVPDVCKDTLPEVNDGTGTGETGNGEPLITGNGSVHYYEGNNWDLRTAETTYDLRKDPFWKLRQSSNDPLDSIIWRGGVGYVKRSVDGGQNWSVITPGTNPPNTAGDAPAPLVSQVTFEHLAMSHVNQGEAMFLVNWLNVTSDGRSWIAYTNDDGVTWNWQYIQGTGGASSINFTVSDFWDNTPPEENIVASIIRILPLTNTCFAIIRQGGSTAKIKVYLFDRVGTNITEQDSYSLGQGILIDATAVSSTDFVVYWIEYNPFPTLINTHLDLFGVTLCSNITLDDTFSFGTVANHLGQFSGAGGAVPSGVERVSGTEVAVLNSTSTLDNPQIDIYTFTIAGAALLAPTITNIPIVDDPGVPNELYVATGFLLKNILKEGFIVYTRDTTSAIDPLEYFFRYVNINTGTVGTPVPFFDSDALLGYRSTVYSSIDDSATFLSNDVAILPYRVSRDDELRIVVIETSGTGINFGTPFTYVPIDSNDYGIPTITEVGTDLFILAVTDNLITGSIPKTVLDSYTVDSSGLTILPNNDKEDVFDGNVVIRPQLTFFTPNLPAFIYHRRESATTNAIGVIKFFTYTPPTLQNGPTLGNSIDSLGLDIDRVNANKMVLTIADDTDERIYRMTYNVPALTLNSGESIGDGIDFSDVSTRLFWAYPLTSWFDTDTYWIFGRFYNPDDLTTINHIIKTTDNATTWVVEENIFGSDHVGAMYEDFLGKLLFIRNDTSLLFGKVYYDFSYKSTLPFFSYVNPHGIAVNNARTLYATAGIANSYMVTRMLFPLVTSNNITFNHGTGNGIKSIEHLL